jgi:hypothetical protein
MRFGNDEEGKPMKFAIKTGWRWLIALAAVFVPAVAAGALTLPYTFTSGTAIRAAEMNANFGAVKAQVDALEAAKPQLVEKSDSATVTIPLGASNAWITGTPATSLNVGSKVLLTATFEHNGFAQDVDFKACYRVGSTVTIGDHRLNTPYTPDALQQFSLQDVFSITTAGSYEFGICASNLGVSAGSIIRAHSAVIIAG